MPLNLASPGIRVREVDLTVGRVDPSSEKIGGLVAPFAQGPIDLPIVIGSEKDLLDTFGKSYSTDKHYEHWMSASSYLAYGAPMRIIRADDDDLKNAYAGSGSAIKIKSIEHYEQLQYDDNTVTDRTVIAKNPGSWANGIRVAIIDGKADQILGVTTTSFAVGMGITQPISATLPGAGTTSVLDGHLKGIITEIGAGTVSVKVLSHVSAAGTETAKDYQPSGVYTFNTTGTIGLTTAGQSSTFSTTTVSSVSDWFDSQTLAISTATVGGSTAISTLNWNNIADKPGTSQYALDRGSRFDEIHVIVLDGEGKISGTTGTILEKHLNLSKAKDAEYSVGSPSYWRAYLKTNSTYIFGGSAPAGIVTSGYSSGFNLASDTGWDQNAEGVIFGSTGKQDLILSSGKNYDGTEDIETSGALQADLSKLVTGYSLFENKENYNVDFLIMGSANYSKEQAQALANKLIAVADVRKDTLAFISPYRGAFLSDSSAGTVTVNNDETITDNVIGFYAPITSSSYGVFDSGYKYMFDRFANTFRYIPLNEIGRAHV